MMLPANFNPQRDLVLERVVPVPPERVWRAWTMPEHLKRWFTPAPWTTPACTLDLRPGGEFRVTMRSPDGDEFSSAGCYLEIVPQQKLVWTTALEPGYRPVDWATAKAGDNHALLFTAMITIEPRPEGTRYVALVMHPDEESRKRHEDMGFHTGWGKALDQLIAVAATL